MNHVDTIRFVLMHQWADADQRVRALSSLVALDAEIQQQADRIAWLEGDAAGWRIKLAAAQEKNQQLRAALEEIDKRFFVLSLAHGDGANLLKAKQIARAALDGADSVAPP